MRLRPRAWATIRTRLSPHDVRARLTELTEARLPRDAAGVRDDPFLVGFDGGSVADAYVFLDYLYVFPGDPRRNYPMSYKVRLEIRGTHPWTTIDMRIEDDFWPHPYGLL